MRKPFKFDVKSDLVCTDCSVNIKKNVAVRKTKQRLRCFKCHQEFEMTQRGHGIKRVKRIDFNFKQDDNVGSMPQGFIPQF